ncbi:hypothetical protein D3C81_1485950 [compost metagenome]
MGLDLVVVHQVADQAGDPGLLGADRLPGERHAHRLDLAHRPHQPLGAADAGHDADADFRLAEARAAPGDDQVGVHRQLATSAIGVTADRRDHRFRTMLDRPPDPLGVAFVDIDGADPGHAVDVATGREHLVTARQHDAAHLGIYRQFTEIPRQQRLQFQTQRIGRLRAVEPQQGHAGQWAFEQNRCNGWVGHGHPQRPENV